MECFICKKTALELPLLRIPIEFKWENVHFEVVGNYVAGEFICMPCLGYQYDYARLGKQNVS